MSVWNAAGTFEEKNISNEAHLAIKTLLEDEEKQRNFWKSAGKNGSNASSSSSSSVGNGEDVDVKINVSKISGDASVIYTRGKKKFGFELEVKLNISGTKGNENVDGSVHFKNVTREEFQNEADCDIDYSQLQGSSQLKNIVKKNIHRYLVATIQQTIENIQSS